MKHFQYLWYIIRHKFFVLEAGLVMRRCGLHISLWRLLMHDMSKLLPSEWFPYVNQFYGEGGNPAPLAFDIAWLKHQHRNPHHWQHWILREDEGGGKMLLIPEQFINEMIADWAGAGKAITGNWCVGHWFIENRSKMILATETGHMLECRVPTLDKVLKKGRSPWRLW